jgi:hypothetical protein
VFCESFCSSAAEEEEYEAFRVRRQLLFYFTTLSLDLFRQPNYLIWLPFLQSAAAGGAS